MYIEQLREMVPPLSQNNVTVCNQIILLIPYYISSRFVILLKITDAPITVSDIFITLLVQIHQLVSYISHKTFLYSSTVIRFLNFHGRNGYAKLPQHFFVGTVH
jgi:hypothetical protein